MISRVMRNRFNEGRMDKLFNGYCYTSKKFKQRENQYRSKGNGGKSNQKNVICYNFNKQGHVSKVYRIKKGNNSALVETNDLVKRVDKEEMKQEMNKIWRKKEEEKPEATDVFVPSSDMDESSEN